MTFEELIADPEHLKPPYFPPAVLASLFRDPETLDIFDYDAAGLSAFNCLSHGDVVDHFLINGSIDSGQAQELQLLFSDLDSRFETVESRSSFRAKIWGMNEDSMLRCLYFGLALAALVRAVGICTPNALAFYSDEDGNETDLVDAYANSVHNLIEACWSKFCFSPDADSFLNCGSWMLTYALQVESFDDFENIIEVGDLYMYHEELLDSHRESVVSTRSELVLSRYDVANERFSQLIRRMLALPFTVMEKLGFGAAPFRFVNMHLYQIIRGLAGLDGVISREDDRHIQRLEQISGECAQEAIENSLSSRNAADLSEESIESILSELDSLIGMRAVKSEVREIVHLMQIQQHRRAEGLPDVSTSSHLVFAGNPGTGKTTVARLMGRICISLGVLSKGHVVECDRAKLVAEYVGQTATKTQEVIDSALDGILFIDEAYTLSRDSKEDFGAEAIEVILKRMEDDRERLIVIVAGYTVEIDQFVGSNPGLRSRFTHEIHFDDFTAEELIQIFEKYAADNHFSCSPELLEAVQEHYLDESVRNSRGFGNARNVRKLFEKTIRRQATRLSKSGEIDRENLTKLEGADFPFP